MEKIAINERDITSIKQFFWINCSLKRAWTQMRRLKIHVFSSGSTPMGFFQISANCVWPLVIQKDLARPQKAFHNFHPIPASYGWLVYFMTAVILLWFGSPTQGYTNRKFVWHYKCAFLVLCIELTWVIFYVK